MSSRLPGRRLIQRRRINCAAIVTRAAVLLLLFAGWACSSQPTPTEVFMADQIQISGLQVDKAFYHPGEMVHLQVHILTGLAGEKQAWLSARITHLDANIDTLKQQVTLSGGDQTVELSFSPPETAPRGYGIDVAIETADGARLAGASTAFDVLDRWTQSPRYGFVSDFQPGRLDSTETMEILTRYHVNALQFYDWMYRHEQFLTHEEPYIDLMGRELSRQTVDALIDAAHQRGIAAMPYTAIYGSSLAFYEEHPDWALYNKRGEVSRLGENFMAIMDPRPGSAWANHLLAQFDEVLDNTAFDGIHLDQYGDPKEG
ncbi:MAG: hypothetical protein EHM70_07675, partial [Chloroflexota bacterium]